MAVFVNNLSFLHTCADTTKVLLAWAREWHKEGRNIDVEKMFPRRGFEILPGAGSRKGPSRGCATTAAWARTMRGCARLPRPSYTRR